MKTTATLKVTKREPMTKGQIKDLRKSGMLPSSINSGGEDSISISVNKLELMKLLSEFGKSSVLKLKMGSKVYNAMIKEMQLAPLTHECINVTFQHVLLNKETNADVPVHAHGRDAVIRKGYEFFQQLNLIPVTGLPNDIPTAIDIDVSKMEAGDTLYVRDVVLPKGIKTDMEPDRVVLTVSYLRAKEAEEAAEKTAAAADVPVVASADKTAPKA